MSGGDGRKALRLVIGAAESNPLYVASRFFHRLKYSVLLPTSESIESKGHGGYGLAFCPIDCQFSWRIGITNFTTGN